LKVYKCLNCSKECKVTSRKKNKYCSVQCQKDFQYKTYIIDWKQGNKDGRKGKLQTSGHLHRYVLEKQNKKCAICDIDTHNGLPIVLELDHINGNFADNTEDNLRCICPNCHSQTSTYKAKNKGNGRPNRKKETHEHT
jgi:hypothetical protein